MSSSYLKTFLFKSNYSASYFWIDFKIYNKNQLNDAQFCKVDRRFLQHRKWTRRSPQWEVVRTNIGASPWLYIMIDELKCASILRYCFVLPTICSLRAFSIVFLSNSLKYVIKIIFSILENERQEILTSKDSF